MKQLGLVNTVDSSPEIANVIHTKEQKNSGIDGCFTLLEKVNRLEDQRPVTLT